jgi:hypothetical protein
MSPLYPTLTLSSALRSPHTAKARCFPDKREQNGAVYTDGMEIYSPFPTLFLLIAELFPRKQQHPVIDFYLFNQTFTRNGKLPS